MTEADAAVTIGSILQLLDEGRVRFQEQVVARAQHDVADLHVQPLAVTGNGHHHGVVHVAKPVAHELGQELRDHGRRSVNLLDRRSKVTVVRLSWLQDLEGGRLAAPGGFRGPE